jgi:hypothetical protein
MTNTYEATVRLPSGGYEKVMRRQSQKHAG